MNNPYEPVSSETESTVPPSIRRTIYHFTSVIAGLGWLGAICYAMLMFHQAEATIEASYFGSALTASVMMSLIVWSAFVRTWYRNSRLVCAVFTATLIVFQGVAIYILGG